MKISSLTLFSLLLLIYIIFPSNSQTLDPIIRSYNVDQFGGSNVPNDVFRVNSTDTKSVFLNNGSFVNYFIVSNGTGGPKMYYNTSYGFTIESDKKITINGSLVQLYRNTSVTICISQGNCIIGSDNTFFINPRELVYNIDPISTRGGIATINGKYFYQVLGGYILAMTFQTTSTTDTFFKIFGELSNQRYFNVSDTDFSGRANGILRLPNSNNIYVDYPVYMNFTNPSISYTEQSGSIIIIHGDNYGKEISLISVKIGSDTFSGIGGYGPSTDKMSVFNHTLLNVTLPDNYVPRSTNISMIVNSIPSITYPIKIVPIIQSITPISYKGGNITITGYRLMVNQSLSVKVGTHNCTSPTQITYLRSFYCNLNMLDDSMVNVTVTVAGVESDPFSYNIIRPRVDTYTQNNRVVSFVGLFDSGSKIMFNGGVYNPLFINDTNIQFQLEYQFNSGMVTIGIPSHNITAFNLNINPTIIDTTPTPTEGGNTTFSVAWPSNSDIFGDVIVARKICLNVVPINVVTGGNPLLRYYQCQVGSGVGANNIVTATINGNISTTVFSYDKPNITRVEQNGNVLNIIGDNFGDDNNSITVDFYNIHETPIKVTSHHEYKIQITEVFDDDLILTVGGQIATYPVKLYPAIVSNITELTTDGGFNTITAMFVRSTSNVTIYIGDKQCNNVTIIESADASRGTNYTCVFPKGSGINNLITFSTQSYTNITSSPNYYYRYQAPSVSHCELIPSNGGILTVKGSSFGSSDQSLITNVEVGSFECTNITVVNSTTLSCTINGTDIKSTPKRYQYVNVTVDGQSGGSSVEVFDVIDIPQAISTASKSSILNVILPTSILGGFIFWSISTFFR